MKIATWLTLVFLSMVSSTQGDGLGETSEALRKRFQVLDTTDEGRALTKAKPFDISKGLAIVFRPELESEKLPANLDLHWRSEEPKHRAWLKKQTEDNALIRRAKISDQLPPGVGLTFGSDITLTVIGGNGWEGWNFVSKGKTITWQFQTKKDKDACLKQFLAQLEREKAGLWLPSFDMSAMPSVGDVGEIRKALVLTASDVVTLQLEENDGADGLILFGVDRKHFPESRNGQAQAVKPIPLRCVWVDQTHRRTIRILGPVTDDAIDKWRKEFRSKHVEPKSNDKPSKPKGD